MTTPLHLTDDELLSLTHLRRPSAQARALQVMGVPYRTRPDGTRRRAEDVGSDTFGLLIQHGDESLRAAV